MEEVTIEIHIDCPPTLRLQEAIAEDVFEILGQEYRRPDITCFGDWIWQNVKTTKDIKEKVGEYLKKVYERNLCRYCAWGEVE